MDRTRKSINKVGQEFLEMNIKRTMVHEKMSAFFGIISRVSIDAVGVVEQGYLSIR